MYLPTDLKTIYQAAITAKREERRFWIETMGKSQDDRTVARLTGQIWTLMDLKDGILYV